MKLTLTGASVALLLSSSAILANDSVQEAIAVPGQWAIQTGDYANTRYSQLDQINRDNVGDMRVAWTFSTGVLRGHEGSPLVIGDIMYVHTPFPNNVFALDLANDGQIIWRYEPQQDPEVIAVMCCDTVNRGLAYADGMILLSQADTTVVALDAKTGDAVAAGARAMFWLAFITVAREGLELPVPGRRRARSRRAATGRRPRRGAGRGAAAPYVGPAPGGSCGRRLDPGHPSRRGSGGYSTYSPLGR